MAKHTARNGRAVKRFVERFDKRGGIRPPGVRGNFHRNGRAVDEDVEPVGGRRIDLRKIGDARDRRYTADVARIACPRAEKRIEAKRGVAGRAVKIGQAELPARLVEGEQRARVVSVGIAEFREPESIADSIVYQRDDVADGTRVLDADIDVLAHARRAAEPGDAKFVAPVDRRADDAGNARKRFQRRIEADLDLIAGQQPAEVDPECKIEGEIRVHGKGCVAPAVHQPQDKPAGDRPKRVLQPVLAEQGKQVDGEGLQEIEVVETKFEAESQHIRIRAIESDLDIVEAESVLKRGLQLVEAEIRVVGERLQAVEKVGAEVEQIEKREIQHRNFRAEEGEIFLKRLIDRLQQRPEAAERIADIAEIDAPDRRLEGRAHVDRDALRIEGIGKRERQAVDRIDRQPADAGGADPHIVKPYRQDHRCGTLTGGRG